eukprot:30819-Pelagococcus_subviridis.AAC.7
MSMRLRYAAVTSSIASTPSPSRPPRAPLTRPPPLSCHPPAESSSARCGSARRPRRSARSSRSSPRRSGTR